MGKDSALYQLMDTRMNGVMNSIVNGDGEYQAIIRKSDEYSDKLDGMELPKEIRLLIDGYAVSRMRSAPGMGCSPTCLAFPTAKPCFWENACLQNRNRCPKKSRKKGLKQRLFFSFPHS